MCPTRVRFAPSPTGIMHLGNVRTALLNFLFALKKSGTFVLRIEDTDPERNFDPGGVRIMKDLAWLGITYQEGPCEGGNYGPYAQSQRNSIYENQLNVLRNQEMVYRCFCSTQELEKKRQRAIALKLPPRYDRQCLALTETQINELLSQGALFVWRFKVPQTGSIAITDMGHGVTTFDLKNFSDFPLSRADGSFTFLFTNAVDDMLMEITHVLRGADHLSNTANQALLFKAFNRPQPLFWHLPILCNVEGKKLSKRDFGFALENLQDGGFLPEAIINYLAIIGASFKNEIMDLNELVEAMNFDAIKAVGNIRYDVDKLRWVNHKWIERYDAQALVQRALPFLEKAYPQIKTLAPETIQKLLQMIKSEISTLEEAVPALGFYFLEPTITAEMIAEHIPQDQKAPIQAIFMAVVTALANNKDAVKTLQQASKEATISTKLTFMLARLALTGSVKGPGVGDILSMLGSERSKERLERFYSNM